MILAKLALGAASTMVFATVYTFREGVIRINVDEHKTGGSHLHLIAPAAVVPMALHFVPKDKLREALRDAKPYLPVVETLTHELQRYPNTTFVDVEDGDDHVKISTIGDKIQIDVVNPEENVHLTIPLAMVNDVAAQLASEPSGPGV
jgi:hypothetical protein